MKITLLTYGSRGDVQPFAALALGLQKAGHEATLAAPNRFTDFAGRYGIPFAPLSGDPEEISVRLNDARGNLFKALRGMQDYMASIADQVVEGAFAACDGAELIVHSFLFTTGGHSLAQAMGVADVSVQTFPMFAPTRSFPNVALARVPPGALSYLSHWLAAQIFWHGGNAVFRQWRKKAPELFDVDLKWPFDSREPFRTPLLFAYSPTVVPRPPDWTAPHIHVTGYLFLDEAEGYQPPQELVEFLESGEPPVCVTFGSMVSPEAGRVDRIVRQALAKTGKRGVILTGWGGATPFEREDHLLYLEAAPHDWLLPRCSAVIHHGGAGTTGAGLRAGIPNLILPHAVDQPFWAQRVAAVGAGPRPIDLAKVTGERLADALRAADDPAIRKRAREIGEQIQAEDGVGEAVEIIERNTA